MVEKNEFNYESLWDKEEKRKDELLLDDISKGSPRKGIKGKYIKKNNHVSKNQIKNSYRRYFKSIKKENS